MNSTASPVHVTPNTIPVIAMARPRLPVADDLRNPAYARRQDGKTRRHRLQDCHRYSFIFAGEHKHVGRLHQARHIIAMTEQSHRLAIFNRTLDG